MPYQPCYISYVSCNQARTKARRNAEDNRIPEDDIIQIGDEDEDTHKRKRGHEDKTGEIDIEANAKQIKTCDTVKAKVTSHIAKP